MRLRTVVGGLLAGAAGTALASRALSARADPLPAPSVGRQEEYRWRGFDVEYTVVGEEDAPDVLLLHGVHAAASAREFDHLAELLAEDYRVVVPDLPGFGRSDRPPVRYSAALYESFLAEFGADVTEDAVCVASSLSGAFAGAAAADAGFSRLVLVCPTDDTGSTRPWLTTLFRSPVLGEGLFALLTARPSLRYFDRREGYLGPPPEDTVESQHRTARQPGARFAPASFVGGELDPGTAIGETLAALDVPVTLVWGREATRPPLAVGRALAERADARLVVIGGARLLPHAEHPEAFVGALTAELGA
jgi:pimeloyl-ACP methyl ester carboxylesterase